MRYIVIGLALMLAGCATTGTNKFDPKPTTEYVYKYKPKPVAPVQTPGKVKLKPVKFDFPRKPDGTIDSSSNLYIGMTQKDFNNLRYNMNATKSRDNVWQRNVSTANKRIQKNNDEALGPGPTKKKPQPGKDAATTTAKTKKKFLGIF